MQHVGKLRDHYRIGKMLGSGAFGEVRVCVHRESGAQRAVKVLRKSHMDDDEKKIILAVSKTDEDEFDKWSADLSESVNEWKNLAISEDEPEEDEEND